MPWLITLVSNLAGFFGIQLAKKTALIAVMITASIALTAALAFAIQATLAGITASLPSDFQAGAMFLPSNLSACLSAVFTAKTARFVYDWNMRNLEMASSIN